MAKQKIWVPTRTPLGRTESQPMMACCMNPKCLEDGDDERFEFEVKADPVVCPKCGADRPPLVHPLVLTHFLTQDKAGKIVGEGGLRYRMACDSKRAYLATHTNLEAATGDAQFVNCPGCLNAIVTEKLVPLQGFTLNANPS